MNSAKMIGTSAKVNASARFAGSRASRSSEVVAGGDRRDGVRAFEHPEHEPEHDARRDPEQDRAADVAGGQRDGDEDARQRDERRPAGQVAEADAGRRVVDDDAALAQADERDEQADADADRELERQRHRPDDRLAQADEHEHDRQQPLDDDAGHADGGPTSRPMMMSNATIALMPRPEASANGTFAYRPIAIDATAAASAVATATASNGTPAAERIAGLTNRM
jgi:hypothetical protein